MISGIVKNTDAAEEVMQQTFLKAWNRFDQYDPNKSALFTWLSIIARSEAIDRVRLKRYRVWLDAESFDSDANDNGQSFDATAAIDVKRLLEKLDEKHRAVLDLKYLRGYSQSEVAQHLNIPLGTVKTRLRSAVKMLRVVLTKEKKYFIGIFVLP